MRVSPNHRQRQTLVPSLTRDISERRTFHSKSARKGVSQIVAAKVTDLCRNHRVIKSMPAISKRFACLAGLEHPASAVAQALDNL